MPYHNFPFMLKDSEPLSAFDLNAFVSMHCTLQQLGLHTNTHDNEA